MRLSVTVATEATACLQQLGSEEIELLRSEIKPQLLSAAVAMETLQGVGEEEEEEPPGHLAWSRCRVCCASSKSGTMLLQ